MPTQYDRTVRRLTRYYNRLPQFSRIAVIVVIGTLMFLQAEYVGETLGKAWYYLTH